MKSHYYYNYNNCDLNHLFSHENNTEYFEYQNFNSKVSPLGICFSGVNTILDNHFVHLF